MTARERLVTGQLPSGPNRVYAARHQVALDGYAARLLVWILGGRDRVRERAQTAQMPDRLVADLDEILAALEDTAQRWTDDIDPPDTSDFRSAVAEVGPGQPSSLANEVLTTREAADMLKVTTRHVTGIADRLGGTKHGRTWLFPRDQVLAYLEDRSAA